MGAAPQSAGKGPESPRIDPPAEQRSAASGAVDAAKKYWWVSAIALPLLLFALARMWPEPKGGAAQAVTNIGSIENEYLTIVGQPLNDEQLKGWITEAVGLQKKGAWAQSASLFEAIAQKAPLPAVYTNLGVAYEQMHEDGKARTAYQQALGKNPGYLAALNNIARLDAPKPETRATTSVGGQEVEPNNDIFHANVVGVGRTVAGAIAPSGDTDFFQFTTAGRSRDWIQIVLENKSTTLQPEITLFDGSKSNLGYQFNATAGADLTYSFVGAPGAIYYAQLAGYSNSTGAYVFTIKPQQAYDKYEPNEDVLHAAPIGFPTTISANVMDPHDVDYYRFTSGPAGKITVTLQNQSTTLAPYLEVRDSTKSEISHAFNSNGGGDLGLTFDAVAHATYYVAVSGYSGSAGGYTLTLK